jgi:hypothetical protein
VDFATENAFAVVAATAFDVGVGVDDAQSRRDVASNDVWTFRRWLDGKIIVLS